MPSINSTQSKEQEPRLVGSRGQWIFPHQPVTNAEASRSSHVVSGIGTKDYCLLSMHNQGGMTPACVCHQVMSDSLWPSQGLCDPSGLLCPWDSPGKNTGVGCRSLPQGIFPTQGWNPCLPCCRQILYHWATGEPRMACRQASSPPSLLHTQPPPGLPWCLVNESSWTHPSSAESELPRGLRLCISASFESDSNAKF